MSYVKKELNRVAVRLKLSWEGIMVTWAEEPSFPQWTIANILSATMTFAFTMTPSERALIIGFGLLVLVVELLNTAVEAAIDLTIEEIHPLAKKAKDTACAAVALTAISTGVIWLLVVVPKFL